MTIRLTDSQVRAMQVFYEELCKRGVVSTGADPLFATLDFRDIAEHLVEPKKLLPELKPCPCGNEVTLKLDGRAMVIECDDSECCWSYRQPYDIGEHTYDSVSAQWNIRN